MHRTFMSSKGRCGHGEGLSQPGCAVDIDVAMIVLMRCKTHTHIHTHTSERLKCRLIMRFESWSMQPTEVNCCSQSVWAVRFLPTPTWIDASASKIGADRRMVPTLEHLCQRHELIFRRLPTVALKLQNLPSDVGVQKALQCAQEIPRSARWLFTGC